jgi:hypothetical protein
MNETERSVESRMFPRPPRVAGDDKPLPPLFLDGFGKYPNKAPVPEDEDPVAAYIRSLLRQLWITKGTRFEANRRLERQHAASHLAISTLSVYVICAALLELLVKSAPMGGHTGSAVIAHGGALHFLFPLATIAAPIFILVLEKHTAGKHYLVKADRMERSALKIQELHSELRFAAASGTATTELLNRIREDYEAVMQDFTANHDNIDYLYFQTLQPDKFPEKTKFRYVRQQIRGRVLHYFDVWFVPASLIVLPGALIGYSIFLLLSGGAK